MVLKRFKTIRNPYRREGEKLQDILKKDLI